MINALIIMCSTFDIETHLLPYHNHTRQKTDRKQPH